jgi:hypothetical protein
MSRDPIAVVSQWSVAAYRLDSEHRYQLSRSLAAEERALTPAKAPGRRSCASHRLWLRGWVALLSFLSSDVAPKIRFF